MKSLFGILLLVMLIMHASGQGILLVKDHSWHTDSQAEPVEYKSAERFNTVYNIRTPSGARKSLLTRLIARDIIYTDVRCPPVLITADDAKLLAARTEKITDTITRWPASRTFLQAFLTDNQAAITALDRGYILADGKWSTRVAYNQEIEATRQLAVERQRQIAEFERERQRQVEERQREAERVAAIRQQELQEEQTKRAEAARQAAANAAADAKRRQEQADADAARAARAKQEQEQREQEAQRKVDKHFSFVFSGIVAAVVAFFVWICSGSSPSPRPAPTTAMIAALGAQYQRTQLHNDLRQVNSQLEQINDTIDPPP